MSSRISLFCHKLYPSEKHYLLRVSDAINQTMNRSNTSGQRYIIHNKCIQILKRQARISLDFSSMKLFPYAFITSHFKLAKQRKKFFLRTLIQVYIQFFQIIWLYTREHFAYP